MAQRVCIFLAAVFIAIGLETAAEAQDTEQRFQDLFITAGYSTAFGAALGAAILGLEEDPASKLNIIYAGASLGFIGGSILGGYIAFAPLFADDGLEKQDLLTGMGNRPGIIVRPVFRPHEGQLVGVTATWNALRF